MTLMRSPFVTIIDYGMGNVGSVRNALEALGAKVKISSTREDIEGATHLVLPGVGSFTEGMKNLEKSGAIQPLTEAVIRDKKPILGLCLGMQMLAETGQEGGTTKGLGWVKGVVKRLDVDEARFHVPHIGWNDVEAKSTSVLLAGIKRTIFYFVHSYCFFAASDTVVAGTTEYGEKFATVVEQGNIFGVQFHPEKSQEDGLSLLKNFLRVSNAVV